jgi:hypothetical protein
VRQLGSVTLYRLPRTSVSLSNVFQHRQHPDSIATGVKLDDYHYFMNSLHDARIFFKQKTRIRVESIRNWSSSQDERRKERYTNAYNGGDHRREQPTHLATMLCAIPLQLFHQNFQQPPSFSIFNINQRPVLCYASRQHPSDNS